MGEVVASEVDPPTWDMANCLPKTSLKRNSGGSKGGYPRRPHHTDQNVLNFMRFFVKFWKIIDWRPLLEGWYPRLGESWIRPSKRNRRKGVPGSTTGHEVKPKMASFLDWF